MAGAIPVRRMNFDFSAVPRHWCGGDPRDTHIINGLSVLFPEGERFFVRSVRHYEAQIADPELKRRIRGFYGQEANHARCHEQTIDMLEAQGFRVRDWVEWYERTGYEQIEPRTPPLLRLSATVALEHLTATLAEIAFDPDDVLKDAHPVMRDLLRWHASEEIEHKAVAFDVLATVDGRLRIRIVGMGMATVLLVGFLASATRHLMAQDTAAPKGNRAVRIVRELTRRPKIVRAVTDYLRRDFHPDQHDNYHLAESWLREAGRLGA